ncbi:TolC family protein [Flavobacterium sp.]|uniref:TolC family protein n=1 Tax=Flavobacterium sp. TaxID=239 RepID=UPI0011FB5B77|nr:TolC family protein [Flavobacterium sp.]RZJ73987.1 MAG: TolC family protein [Flavobacterium sp.]
MRKITAILALLLASTSISFAQEGKKWTLRECVEYALKNNIQIKQSELDIQLAAIDKKDAIGNFLPSLNASANHSWNIGLNQNITTGLLENQTTQFTQAGLNAGIDIYKGLQNQNTLRRSKLSIIAAQYRLDKMKDDVSLNVANAFLQILFNKENLKVQKAQLANNQKLMTRTQELVNAGSVPRGDLADMKATVATSQKAVVDAENVMLISRLSLAQLLQIEDFKDFDVADNDYEVFESPVMQESPKAIFEKAKEARNEIKIARANLELAEKDVKIARGTLQPNLQGFYSFSTRASYADRVIGGTPDPNNPTTTIGTVEGTGQNVIQPNFIPVLGKYEPIFDQFSANKGHNFGLQLSIPILNGFQARNGVERSKVALERSKIAFSQAELDLERNVYQAFVDAKNALQSYETALVAVEARELAFNYAQERYNVGMMNSFDLNQAQTLFVNSQSDAARAKFDYIFRVKVVEFYFGIPIQQK